MAARLFFSFGLLSTVVLGSPPETAIAARAFDCSPGSETGLKPECWAQLNVSDYITKWLAENGTKADCDNLGFAQCFLAFNGYGGRTCDTLTRDTCAAFETAGVDAAYSSPQQFYTLWNIYAISQFFNQFSEALWNGHTLAADTIGDIVATVSPSTDPEVPSNLLWTSISGGFWMAAVGAFANPLLAGVATGMAVVTGMSSFFMSSVAGSSNSRFITLGEIGSSLAQLIIDYQGSLEGALKELQGNSTLFLAATEPGGFSQRAVTSLNLQSTELYHDLQLYILSLSLKANGIVSTRSTGVNALDYAPDTNGAVSCPGLGPAGNCYQFWIDPDTGDSYALHNPKDWKNDYVDVLNKIHDKNWANLSEIFKVEDCQGKDPSFDGKTKVTCLASHGFCEWDYVDQDTVTKSRTANKQFTNCDNDKSWGTLCDWMNGGLVMPEAYLGPLFKFQEPAWCREH
ncbi:hypothetical protein CPAR01_08061 [Colletotrichum paranaense]|uniref:Uncharacterized protein n=2 Tax=Colletotrichum acutatum species complex TaxID=2707335 RepID=A0ABQ9PC45_9PEZI|nr:uncharacterized protein CPAR01_08061 [Colletotrichum paranaense]KAK0369637.1 hypothetical protein CLIM01_13005 [Colletotrichum limetticola]KAK1537948.1 hypothetical protein CPAR01_08061 [Colletotrichum paranaense]